MTKNPKQPSQSDDLKRRNDEGGKPRSRVTNRKPRTSPKRKGEAVLETLNAETLSGAMEAPEQNADPILSTVQDEAPANARRLHAEGNQMKDQQGPHHELSGVAKQGMQPLVVEDVPASQEPDHSAASDLSQPSEGLEIRANQNQESLQHHPMVYELRSGGHEDRKGASRIDLGGTVQRTISVWSPRLQAASKRVRGTSGRVKVWAQERATRRVPEGNEAEGSANPVYILGAITLGIPALLLIPLVGMNPGVQEGTFTTVLAFLVVSAFVMAAVFEIKRLADQSSDDNHH